LTHQYENNMNKKDILTDEFSVHFEPNTDTLLIYTIHENKKDRPIRLKLDTLIEMGGDGASKWVGETILLLIPEIRKRLFNLEDT
jgi:hypothetical protein